MKHTERNKIFSADDKVTKLISKAAERPQLPA